MWRAVLLILFLLGPAVGQFSSEDLDRYDSFNRTWQDFIVTFYGCDPEIVKETHVCSYNGARAEFSLKKWNKLRNEAKKLFDLTENETAK